MVGAGEVNLRKDAGASKMDGEVPDVGEWAAVWNAAFVPSVVTLAWLLWVLCSHLDLRKWVQSVAFTSSNFRWVAWE